MDIDIKPGSPVDPIGGVGGVPVAILGSDTLDVTDADLTTLKFGPAGAAPAHAEGGHVQDVDGDGHPDLLSHYPTHDTGIVSGDSEACVTGELLDGTLIEGCDSIVTVPRCGLGAEWGLLAPLVARLRRRSR